MLSKECKCNVRVSDYFGKKVHLIGIGGSSMSGLALLLLDKGCIVTGSDKTASHKTDELQKKGIRVTIGHSGKNVEGADLLIYSAAISKENPERKEAARAGIPQMERCTALGQLMEENTYSVCVSGTNGKTTTAAMIAQIFLSAGKDPTVHIGGNFDLIGGGTRCGTDGGFIVEACEFNGSFLSFFPTVAVILNITEDHLDYYKNIENIETAFRSFTERIPSDGWCIAFGDDARARRVCEAAGCHTLTFGLQENNDVRPSELLYDKDGRAEFDAVYREKIVGHFRIGVPGEINLLNSLAAIAVSVVMGIDLKNAEKALWDFTGVQRRFWYTGTAGGVECYSDYGHNPVSIVNALKLAGNRAHGEIWSVFQPHTYSRTKFLFDQFVNAFDGADHVLVTDIFAAREEDPGDIHSEMLVKAMKEKGVDAHYTPGFDEAETYLKKHWHKGDLMITHGCGNIILLNEQITAHEEVKCEKK